MVKIKLHDVKLESMRAQLYFLEAIQGRHEIWAGGVDDPEIENAHRRIIELVRETRKEYMLLLRMYYPKAPKA
jgi:hypothetical protein